METTLSQPPVLGTRSSFTLGPQTLLLDPEPWPMDIAHHSVEEQGLEPGTGQMTEAQMEVQENPSMEGNFVQAIEVAHDLSISEDGLMNILSHCRLQTSSSHESQSSP